MSQIPVGKIAQLSNLTLSDMEESQIGGQLEKTVDYVENLQELETGSIAPTASPSGNVNVFFEDQPDEGRKIPAGVYKVDRILK